MFGSVVKLLFTEILGIRQAEDGHGFQNYTVEPAHIPALRWAEGSVRTAAGTISVRWNRNEDGRLELTSHITPTGILERR